MKINFKKTYIFFGIISLGIITLMVSVLSFMTYHTLIQKIDMDLESEALRIEHALSSKFDEIQSLMIFTGKRIAKKNIQDLQVIWEELHEFLSVKKIHQKVDWPNVAWLNNENILAVNANYGIYSEPQDLSFRKYPHKARQQPWILHFDPPALAIPTNNSVLNSGLGVFNEKENFLGVLAAGFDIDDLTKQLRHISGDSLIRFAVYNEDIQLALKSVSDVQFKEAAPILEKIAEKARKIYFSYHPTMDEDNSAVKRYNVKNLSHFPFTVITYIDGMTIKKEWFRNVTPHFIELGCAALVFLIILLIFWKRFQKQNHELDATRAELEYAFSLAKASDAAKEEFLNRTNVVMVLPLTAIKGLTAFLRRSLSQEMHTELSVERQIEIYDEILDHAQDFKNLTNHVLILTEVDIQEIIQDCVTIHSKTIFEKKINIKMTFPDNLPRLICDEVKIKQIFVGIISRAIYFSPCLEKITITANLQTDENRKMVQIIIEDKGFAHDDEKRQIEENFDYTSEALDTHLNLSTIERLVYMHRGEIGIEYKQSKGTSITLRFPLETQEKSFRMNKITALSDEL